VYEVQESATSTLRFNQDQQPHWNQ